ncbi:MAG: trypsin-like serine protease [Alsobacter sp.]
MALRHGAMIAFAAVMLAHGAGRAQEIGSPHPGEIADPAAWPASAIGSINVTLGTSRRKSCTGALVAPKLVLTAAHCLFDAGRAVPIRAVHIQFGLRRGEAKTVARAVRMETSRRYDPGENEDAAGARDDWGLVHLDRALAIRPLPVRPMDPIRVAQASQSGAVLQIGYGRDRPYLPSIVRQCRVVPSRTDAILQFHCLNNYGYSGAPIIVAGQQGPAIVAIGSRMTLSGEIGWACAASQFADAVRRAASAPK